jgi:multidrug efflux system membrane fusion protein
VEFAVPEGNLAALRARRSGPLPVRIRAGAGPELEGELAFVNNAVDPATGTLLLKARVANEDETLWPGQTVDVRLRIGERARAVVVPASAVAAGQQGDYAYVVTPERKAQLRPVVVEQAGEAEAVISKGIAPGELVVTEGQLKLRPDAPVELLQDPSADAR